MNEARTWHMLTLSHYSAQPIDGQLRLPDGDHTGFGKPRGIWLSVDGNDDWPAWCIGEGWRIEALAHRYVVKLAPAARIIHLKSESEVREFSAAHDAGVLESRYDKVDWREPQMTHDGIIIAPYQWQCRYDFLWYYGWDCASGVIWNPDVIQSVTLDESWVVPKRNDDAA